MEIESQPPKGRVNNKEKALSVVGLYKEADSLEEAEALTKKVFGYDRLRPSQAEVLKPFLAGRDTLAVLPTGGGKTVCYAIPALMGPGLAVVVSPLVALLRDQVIRLRKVGIPAACVDSLQTPEERRQVYQALRDKRVKILLVSPERLSLPSFREALKAQNLRFIAIDEAHCISQWGHHFRPEYRQLGEYFKDFPNVKKLALTATATSAVRGDVIACLGMEKVRVVMSHPTRDNLKIDVVHTTRVKDQIYQIVTDVIHAKGQGLIYVPTRKLVEKVVLALKEADVSVLGYHGGMIAEQREFAQKSFIDGSARVVVATNAFGLGIDKGDIRFVHHCGLPQSLEQYVQEIGRAGRDDREAKCTLVVNSRDYHVQKFLIEKSFEPEINNSREEIKRLKQHEKMAMNKLNMMQKYANSHLRRMSVLNKYFD